MGYKHCRSTILDQGTELIRRKGYHNVGINEILKVCGIPKGSFYNFFKNKEDFIEQSIRSYGAQGTAMLEQYLMDTSYSPIHRLRRFYQAMIENFSREGCTAGCLLANLSMEIGGINAHLAAVADEMFQHNLSLVTACVLEAQKTNSLTTAFPAPYLAEYLQAGLSGAISRMKVQHDRRFLDQWHKMTFALLAPNPVSV